MSSFVSTPLNASHARPHSHVERQRLASHVPGGDVSGEASLVELDAETTELLRLVKTRTKRPGPRSNKTRVSAEKARVSRDGVDCQAVVDSKRRQWSEERLDASATLIQAHVRGFQRRQKDKARLLSSPWAMAGSASLPVLKAREALRGKQQGLSLERKALDTLPHLSSSCLSTRSTVSEHDVPSQCSSYSRVQSNQGTTASREPLPALQPEKLPSSLTAWDSDSVLSSARSGESEARREETRDEVHVEPFFCRRQPSRDVADELDATGSAWHATDALFRADGTKHSTLRDTIRSALHGSTFESIPSLLASNVALRRQRRRPRQASTSPRRDIVLGQRAQPVFVAVVARPDNTHKAFTPSKRVLSGRSKPNRAPYSRDVTDPGFHDHVEHAQHPTWPHDEEESGSVARHEAPRVCFNCWSASTGHACHLHRGANDSRQASALMCGKWELEHLRRQFRAEEIQEVFQQYRSCLRVERPGQRYVTRVECRHPIYRTMARLNRQWNQTMRRKLHTRAWVRSVMELLRLNRIPRARGSEDDQPHCLSLVQVKKTLQNARWVAKYTEQVRDELFAARRTETDWRTPGVCPKRDVILMDPACPEQGKWILVTEYPIPVALYEPRVYDVPPPRCVPMSGSSLVPRIPLAALNVHMEAGQSASWVERVSAHFAIAGMRNAVGRMEAWSVPQESTNARGTSSGTSRVVPFATFARKSTRDFRDIGGFSAHIVMHMLVTTYIPAQFGNFVVFDSRPTVPLPAQDDSASFACLQIDFTTPVYVVRDLEHALNHRRPPCIVVASNEGRGVPRHFPLNRPEQTGEDEANGFRTYWLVDSVPVSDIVPTVDVIPSGAVLAPNVASMNATCTTRVDRTYPFCVPTTREKTVVEFMHLLYLGRSSRNQPQAFTTLGRQEPGDFMKNSDPNGSLGPCTTVVYRSWAYMQDSPYDEFVTDDGVAYWYDRKTGGTFWTRPILPTETHRGNDGDIDGVVTTGEGEVATLGIGLNQPVPYSQEKVRKFMTRKLEAPEDKVRRVHLVATSAKNHPLGVAVTPNKVSVSVKTGDLHRIHVPQLVVQHKTCSPQVPSGTMSAKPRVEMAGNDGLSASKAVEETALPLLDENTKQMIDSLTQALGSAFPALHQGNGTATGASVDMLQLGIGLGMGLNMRVQQQGTSPLKSSVGPRPKDCFPIERAREDGQVVDSERSERDSDLSSRSEQSMASVALSPTPESVEHSRGQELGTERQGPVDPSYQRVAALPLDFVATVSRTHTCRMAAKYLPVRKNSNEPKSVGNVRPRTAFDEWLALGYSPWSAGRSVFGTQFIDDLVLRPELVTPLATVPEPAAHGTHEHGAKRVLASPADAALPSLETLFSLCRHGKYNDIELLLSRPDWSYGIDAKDATGNTLLSVACQNNNKRIAKLCLRRGADLDTQNLNGQSVLHYCHEYGFHDLMEYLLDKGARDDLLNADGLTCYEGLSRDAVDAL